MKRKMTRAYSRPAAPLLNFEPPHGFQCQARGCTETATTICLWNLERTPSYRWFSKQLCEKHAAQWRARHADILATQVSDLIV